MVLETKWRKTTKNILCHLAFIHKKLKYTLLVQFFKLSVPLFTAKFLLTSARYGHFVSTKSH